MKDHDIEEMKKVIEYIHPVLDSAIDDFGVHAVANSLLNIGVMMAIRYGVDKEDFVRGVTDAWDGHSKKEEAQHESH